MIKDQKLLYLAIKLFDWIIEFYICCCYIVHALVLAFIKTIPPKYCQIQWQLARIFIMVASPFAAL